MSSNRTAQDHRPGHRPDCPDGDIVHLLRVDFSNKSFQIIAPSGKCVALYSHVHDREAALRKATADGWRLTPGTWTHSCPPDGYEHPVRHNGTHAAP